MALLIDSIEARLGSEDSAIGFETEGGGSWKVWDRYLTLDGKRAYHIGNICNTCSFFFERLDGANGSMTVAEIADELASGLASLTEWAVGTWGRALPAGEYSVCLFDASPVLVAPGSAADYFTHEQADIWGIDAFWGMPHHPHTEYYRLGSVPVAKEGRVFEFLIPMFPRNWLKTEDVARYTTALEQGVQPAAVAISVLDVKQPANWDGEPAVTEHWCLAHYVLDGHHKIFAAAQSGCSMRLLSFLALEHGIADRKQIGEALRALQIDAL